MHNPVTINPVIKGEEREIEDTETEEEWEKEVGNFIRGNLSEAKGITIIRIMKRRKVITAVNRVVLLAYHAQGTVS